MAHINYEVGLPPSSNCPSMLYWSSGVSGKIFENKIEKTFFCLLWHFHCLRLSVFSYLNFLNSVNHIDNTVLKPSRLQKEPFRLQKIVVEQLPYLSITYKRKANSRLPSLVVEQIKQYQDLQPKTTPNYQKAV